MRRTSLILAVAAVSVLLILVLVHLFSHEAPARGTPPQVVKVAQAASGDMPEMLTELGTVTPIATVTVQPQLSGYLTEVGYREGEDVTKGQFLAQIDPRQFEIDLQQAQAQLLKDQATLAQARSDLARFHQLRAQKAIAEQLVTDQEFLVQQDEAQVKTDQANIALFRLDLVYCHITAPVAGRHAEVEAAKAAYEAAVANYRGTVLTAFQGVENDLSGLRILGEQAQALDVAVRDAERGSQIARAEFQAGTVDYTTVALAEETLLADQQSALSVQQSRLVDAVSLIGDLGGGWSRAQLHDPLQPGKRTPANATP